MDAVYRFLEANIANKDIDEFIFHYMAALVIS